MYPLFLSVGEEVVNDGRIGEGGGVAEVRGVVFGDLRRMRRMILPERVLGKPGAQWITSGVAMGPISVRTCWTSSALRSSV